MNGVKIKISDQQQSEALTPSRGLPHTLSFADFGGEEISEWKIAMQEGE